MIAYEFYCCGSKGEERLIGFLPERRKNSEGITNESIMKWGKMVLGYNTEVNSISLYFIQVKL